MLETRHLQTVLAKNYGQGPPYIPGKLLEQSGTVTSSVELTDGTIVHCHLDELKFNMTTVPSKRESATTPFLITFNHFLHLN